jgi:hypothetical protein
VSAAATENEVSVGVTFTVPEPFPDALAVTIAPLFMNPFVTIPGLEESPN